MSRPPASDRFRVAFYAPLKSPHHPVPSGDRLMARMLMTALRRAGHDVSLVSELRAFLPDAGDGGALAALRAQAAEERARIAADWRRAGVPDLFLCYHPYYKSPDLLGPTLAADAGIPWVSAEASLSSRRDHGIWAETQGEMRTALAGAAVNIGLTLRDLAGLRAALPDAHLDLLPPFLDLETLPPAAPGTGGRLVCVAMMRAGDKLSSYRDLAAALRLLPGDLDWQLTVVGDGPARGAVHALFDGIDPARIDWKGAVSPEGVMAALAEGAVYVWPGLGEAYGLAYLEAQAAGLPVVAWDTAGVPEVVSHGETGLLVPLGHPAGLAAAIAALLRDPGRRAAMARAGRARVAERHAMAASAQRLDSILRRIAGKRAA